MILFHKNMRIRKRLKESILAVLLSTFFRETLLLKVHCDIAEILNKGPMAALILLDPSASFGVLDNVKLLVFF